MKKNKNKITHINYKRFRDTALILVLAGTMGFVSCENKLVLEDPEIIENNDDDRDIHGEIDPEKMFNEIGHLKTFIEVGDDVVEEMLVENSNSVTIPFAEESSEDEHENTEDEHENSEDENENTEDEHNHTEDEHENTEDEHKHHFGEWLALNEKYHHRICEEDGYEEKEKHHFGKFKFNIFKLQYEAACKDCGYVKIKDHSHNFGSWESYDDTLERRVCSEDGVEEFRKHKYGSFSYNSKTGKEEATCSQCGHKISKEHSHSFTMWQALNDMYEFRKCTIDGYIEKRSHKYGLFKYNKNTGKEEATCSQCGHVMTREHSHTFDGWKSFNDELEFRICPIDGFVETRSHKYGSWKYNSKTGNEERTCSQCGHKMTRSHTHSFTEWSSLDDNYEFRKCTIDGYIEKRSHNYSEWRYNSSTGKDERTCSQCGHKMTRSHSHRFTEWLALDDDFEYRKCLDDGYIEKRSHKYGPWSYNATTKREEATCSQCGHVKARSHTHSFGQWFALDENYEARTCSTDGYQEKRPHNYGDWVYNKGTGKDDATCSQCGFVKHRDHVHSHSWIEDIEKYQEPNKCYRPYHICYDDDCPQKGQKIYTGDVVTTHDYKVVSYTHGRGSEYDAVISCSVCGYTTNKILDYEPTIGSTITVKSRSRLSHNMLLALDEIVDFYYTKDEEEDAKTLVYKS